MPLVRHLEAQDLEAGTSVQVPAVKAVDVTTNLGGPGGSDAPAFFLRVRTGGLEQPVVNHPYFIVSDHKVVAQGNTDAVDGTIRVEVPNLPAGAYSLRLPSRPHPESPDPLSGVPFECTIWNRNVRRFGAQTLRIPDWGFDVVPVVGPSRAPARAQNALKGRDWLHTQRFEVSKRAALGKPPDKQVPEVGADVGFVHKLNGDPLKTPELIARDQSAFEQLTAGNMPSYCRDWTPVTLESGLTIRVMPDVLAIGDDEDHVRIPISGHTTSRLARLWGCTLMTPHLIEETYLAVREKRVDGIALLGHPLNAQGVGGGYYQLWNECFRWHEDIIQGWVACDGSGDRKAWYGGDPRSGPGRPGRFDPFIPHPSHNNAASGLACHLGAGKSRHPRRLVVGHKKEVVVNAIGGSLLHFWGLFGPKFEQGKLPTSKPRKINAAGNRVPVDLADGHVTQNTSAHGPGYCDYSHGARLLHPKCWYDGKEYDVGAVMAGTWPDKKAADAVRLRLTGATTPWLPAQLQYEDVFVDGGPPRKWAT